VKKVGASLPCAAVMLTSHMLYQATWDPSRHRLLVKMFVMRNIIKIVVDSILKCEFRYKQRICTRRLNDPALHPS
jgi:hypothetical protein